MQRLSYDLLMRIMSALRRSPDANMYQMLDATPTTATYVVKTELMRCDIPMFDKCGTLIPGVVNPIGWRRAKFHQTHLQCDEGVDGNGRLVIKKISYSGTPTRVDWIEHRLGETIFTRAYDAARLAKRTQPDYHPKQFFIDLMVELFIMDGYSPTLECDDWFICDIGSLANDHAYEMLYVMQDDDEDGELRRNRDKLDNLKSVKNRLILTILTPLKCLILTILTPLKRPFLTILVPQNLDKIGSDQG